MYLRPCKRQYLLVSYRLSGGISHDARKRVLSMLPFYCPICFLTYLLGISPYLNHASLIWLGGY